MTLETMIYLELEIIVMSNEQNYKKIILSSGKRALIKS